MEEIKITPKIVAEQGLTQEEYQKICQRLGREPNYTELGLFSAMWSEHCSYKNSKLVLRLFPVSGKQVIQGPGENAGVVDIGDGMAVVMKVESHNHPSAIEPFEASATGGGGVTRDIFTMGARPVGLLYSLRFGRADNKQVQYLLREVGRGFFYYANIAGMPVLGGEIFFDSSYEKNPLVNAMCVGILDKKNLVRARASTVGSSVYTIGGAAGRDGVGGAAFASEGMDDTRKIDSSAVAIGDPKLGTILRQACLELIEKNYVEGMQDMGAAGLVCSTSEMAYKGGRGMEIDVSL
ncbi:MAG: AIR synthase related protein, partial [Candidatus Ratteibacteria bacterium]|nr:AIR synthase related protein [Candidatus Ratteibacteria bacterium]